MLKIPKQIYLDVEIISLFEQYARQQGKSFSAVIRETLAIDPPKINKIKGPSRLQKPK